MKYRLSFGSKEDKLVIPPSPIKENPTNGDRPIIINNNNNVVAVKSQWSPSRSNTSFGVHGMLLLITIIVIMFWLYGARNQMGF